MKMKVPSFSSLLTNTILIGWLITLLCTTKTSTATSILSQKSSMDLEKVFKGGSLCHLGTNLFIGFTSALNHFKYTATSLLSTSF